MADEVEVPTHTPEELARYARWETGVQNGGEPAAVTTTEETVEEPETPIEEADEATDDEVVEGEEVPHKKKSGVQRLKEKLRISEEARIRAEERAAVLEEIRKPKTEPEAKPAPTRPAKPDLDAFEGTQAEYLEARDAWLLGEFEAKQETRAAESKVKVQAQTRQEAWDAQVQAAKTRLPELEKVLNVPFATAATPSAQGDPYASVSSPVHPVAATDWQSQVQPIDIGNGKASVKRSDGGVWFGPEQGNTGKAGWFDGKGNRMGVAPGVAPTGPGFFGGVASGMKTAGRAVSQSVTQAMGHILENAYPTGTEYAVHDMVNASNHDFAQRQAQADTEVARGGWKAKTGSFVGQAIPAVATIAATGGPAAPTFWGRVATALPVSVSTAMATAPGTEKQKAVAGAIAIPGTVVGQAAAESLGWLTSKAVRALAGTALGNKLGIATKLNPRYAGAPELSTELDQAGITSHTVGDVTGDPVVRAHENALARNNPAMMELRLKENAQAAKYAQGVIDDLKSTVRETGWQNLADVEAAAAAGGKRSGQAQAILTAVKNSGSDWQEIAQQSGNLKLFVNKLQADQLYDKASAIADTLGDVNPVNTRKALGESLNVLKGNTAADEGTKSFLGRIKAGLAPSVEATPAVADAYGVQRAAATPGKAGGVQDLSFEGMRRLRSSLNQRIQDIRAGKVSVSGEEITHLERVQGAIERDIQAFGQSNGPELQNAFTDASAHYKSAVVPYKEAAFGKALADTDPLKAANLFKGQNTQQQERFFSLLDAKGKAAIRAGLVEDAISAGEKTQRGAMGQTFGAASAAGKLEQLQRNGVMGVAFPGGEDTWAASGLAKILRTVDRSDNVGFTPPTGVTAQSIGAKAEGNTTLIGAVAKAYDWLNKDRLMTLYSNPKGRALLIHAGNLTPGSPAMLNLINNQIPKVLGVTAGRMGSSTAQAPETPNDRQTPTSD